MHVVFVDTTLTTFPTGGGQTFLVMLCAALAERGWVVSVVTQPGKSNSVVDALLSKNVRVYTKLWPAGALPEERAGLLRAWVERSRPDLYVVSISPDVGWLTLPLLGRRTATLSIAHNDVPAFYVPLAHYGPFVDCAIGVSETTHRRVMERGRMPPERSRQIPYGVRSAPVEILEGRGDLDGRAGRPLRLGYVGRLEQSQKRVMDLVPLAAELRRRGVDFELHLIGDGEARSRLADAFRAQGLQDLITFWGWLNPGQIFERLRELDVFLLLSEMEGLPVALLEAMAHALIPIVTRIASGNMQLVRDGVNGFAVDVGDTRAVAERVELLAADAGLRRRLRRESWETARNYSVEAMVERYLQCFHHVADPAFDRSHRPEPGLYPVMADCRSRFPRWARKLKSRVRGLRRES